MKRFFLLLLSIWKQQLKLYAIAALIGACIGVVLLTPTYDYITAALNDASPPISSPDYIIKQINGLFSVNFLRSNRELILFYAEIGGLFGVISLFLYKLVHKKLLHIDRLKEEMNKDLSLLIMQGEGSNLEFKSTFRWDLVESRINRTLEAVVMKTVAGFLNSSNGGNLLIGVADDGKVLGLDNDYQTLKKMDQDGFEQAVMTAVSTNLGADMCPFVHVLFYTIGAQQVCRLIIMPSNRPVFVEQGNTPKFFVRTGGGTRDLNIQEAVSYIFHRWHKLNKQQLQLLL
jgi:hypothetical protein